MGTRRAIRAGILLLLLGLLLPPALAFVNTTGPLSLAANDGSAISVTFSNPSTTPAGGGGGGGGGGLPGDGSFPALSSTMSHYFDKLLENQSYTVNVPSSSSAILLRRLTFSVTHEEDGVTVQVTHLDNLSGLSTPSPDAPYAVLGYERVDHPGLGLSEIAPSVDVEFGVPLDALQQAGIAVRDVRLLRYSGTRWVELPTAVVSQESDGSALFRANSPGLSLFAVAGTQQAALSASSPSESGSSAVTGAATASEPPATGARSAGPAHPAPSYVPNPGSRIPLASLAIVLFLGAVIGTYYYLSRVPAKLGGTADPSRPVGTAAFSDDEFDRVLGEAIEPAAGPAGRQSAPAADPVAQLKDYVDTELRQGLSRDAIASQLRSVGWPENVIASVLDEFRRPYLERHNVGSPHEDYGRVLAFLEKKLSLGYDAGVLEENLVRTGWDAALIGTLLKEALNEGAAATTVYSVEALAALRSFAEKELRGGFSKQQVRAALLKAGWQAKVVDDELAKRPG